MNVEQRMEAIRRLCSFEGRLAGTDAERRAANDLASQLREGGRRVDVEPTFVHPQWPLVHALHCVLALAGSLVALSEPPIGFAIVLATAFSMYLDLNGRVYLLRRIFFRRASQNVVSPDRRRDAAGTIVLCANYDCGRGGTAYGRRTRRAMAAAARLVPAPFSPARLVFWSIALLLPLIGLRMAGVEESWVSVLQLPPTLVLVVAVFLLVDIQLSDPVPGANDNASGVASVLSLAAELHRDPPEHLAVWVVLAGAGDPLEAGMRAFVREHRDVLEKEATWFIDIESVGDGDVRFETSQGLVVSYGMASRLTELCAAIADADPERDPGERLGARPLRSGFASGSMPPLLAGYPATTVTCLADGELLPQGAHTTADVPEALDPATLDRAHRFTVELIRALDRDLSRRAGREAAAVI